ncbi:DEAD/DEAH box helicase [Patescibacteria group bacterium]|nr:DEAD/DEAH box helicase [Patescibacteria group bacterium]
MINTNNETSGFAELGIAQSILNQLQKLGFTKPTPIQHQAIPIGIAGQDIMGIAQTGTGKTLAFGIPMLQRLHSHKGTGLILLPTRELAAQVDQALDTLGRAFGLRTAVLIGGAAIGPQIRALANRPHIIIATPGRLLDHLSQKKVILNTVKILVLDEADRMLDMGFEPQIKKILSAIPSNQRQTMLFSATMPKRITKLAESHMRSPLRVEVAPAGTTLKSIEQEVFIVPKSKKLSLLNQLLSEYRQRILIFSRTKYGARRITSAVQSMGHRATEIHSNKSLPQRTKALADFKSGSTRILVATDIASRGIDVQDIEVVINYDLPDNPEDYVHRIGRTGRAGKAGRAISFASPEQRRDIYIIEELVRTRLPIRELPDMKEFFSMPKASERGKWQNDRPQRARGNFDSKNRSPRPFKRGRRNGR